jgi:hypothetical protein
MKGTIYHAEMSVLFEAARKERITLVVGVYVVGYDQNDAVNRFTKNPEPALWGFRKKSDRNKKLKVLEVKNIQINRECSKTIHDLEPFEPQ